MLTINDEKIPVPQEVGSKRSEIDVAVAIGRLPRQALEKQLTRKDLYYDFLSADENTNRRLQEYRGESFENVKKKDLEIDYTPVRYKLSIEPEEDEAFIENMHSLQTYKSNKTLSLIINGQELESLPFATIKQHSRFTKNHYSCTAEKGLR